MSNSKKYKSGYYLIGDPFTALDKNEIQKWNGKEGFFDNFCCFKSIHNCLIIPSDKLASVKLPFEILSDYLGIINMGYVDEKYSEKELQKTHMLVYATDLFVEVEKDDNYRNLNIQCETIIWESLHI